MSWPLVKVSEFCRTGSGGTPSRKIEDYYGGIIPWIKSGDLKENIIREASEFVTPLALEKSSIKIVPEGAILVAMYGATVGRMAMLGINATTNQAVCHLVVDESVAFQKYVYYALKSKVPGFLRDAVGGAQPNISQGLIRDTTIPLPPLTEQKRIAAILDKADVIRRKRQQAIQLADEFLRALFLEMFGDPVTNQKGWDVVELGELVVRGPTNGLYKPASEYGSGTRILRIDGFYHGRLVDQNKLRRVRLSDYEVEKFGLLERSIIINRVNSREYLGKCAFIECMEEKTVYESNMMSLSVDENSINPRFLVELFQTRYVKNQILNSAKDAVNQSSINQQDVKSLKVLVPPLDLQVQYEKIAKVFGCFEKLFTHNKIESEELFSTLSQKAFSGQL